MYTNINNNNNYIENIHKLEMVYKDCSLGSRPSPYVRVVIARGWANRSLGKLRFAHPAQLKCARNYVRGRPGTEAIRIA